MSSSDRPKRNSGHAFRAVGDEGGLVVVPEDSKVEVLNPVGSRIYSLLDGSRSQDEIIRTIVEEFEVTEDQARGDLQMFLDQLEAHSMLDGNGPGA